MAKKDISPTRVLPFTGVQCFWRLARQDMGSLKSETAETAGSSWREINKKTDHTI